MFKAKLKLQSGNLKIQYDCQAAILKVSLLKINRFLSIYASNLLLKFGPDIQSQIQVDSPETEESNFIIKIDTERKYLSLVFIWYQNYVAGVVICVNILPRNL